MADVRIRFSRERAAAAERLRDAISAEGYRVALAEISDVQDLVAPEDRHQAERATLLIWSRPLVLSALRPNLLPQLRQQRKLIEVSADGVGPDGGEGDTHVILISGWRGQPFHPGWQRLASELKRLCGAPSDMSEPSEGLRQIKVPATPESAPVEAKRSKGRFPVARLALALLAALGLFGAGFATATWIGQGPSLTRKPPPAGTPGTRANPPPVSTDPAASPDVAIAPPSDPPRSSGLAASEPAQVEPRSVAAPLTAAPPSPAAREEPKTPSPKAKRRSETRPTKGSTPVRREIKPYSRRHSQVMRQFCEGAGRLTPECRTFLRSAPTNRR